MPGDAERIAELQAIVEAIQNRVHRAHGQTQNGFDVTAAHENILNTPIHIVPTDLMLLVHARDAAQAKVAAIGSVNPRAGGPLNRIAQWVKRTIARGLQWFIRDQIVFNRETMTAIEATIEALAEQNRAILALGAETNERFAALTAQMNERFSALAAQTSEHFAELQPRLHELREITESTAREMLDTRSHWVEWRAGWEHKLSTNEIYFLRSSADLQSAFQHRVTLIESNFREIVTAQHRDYLGALDRANLDIQKRLWADLEKVRENYERLIHSELRLIRLRAGSSLAQTPIEPAAPTKPLPPLDYSRFAERFRGTDEQIRRGMEFYRPFFAGRENVLDIGCGRGEFLEAMRESGVHARGIDLSSECVAQCHEKGLEAEVADMFQYLDAQPDGEFDGILSSQVIEHLPPAQVPVMIRLCAQKLRRNGILALETPNPECLAIFATYFYLDPTHTRPMPHQYVQFCMEEAGMSGIEVHRLSPAVESMPELASLPGDFRERFFGGLDYAIIGRKI